MERHDAIIIGSGLGGLLTASYLSRSGFRTLVLERLGFVGGRFANIPYKGFQLSTGAVHMVPHRRGLVVKAVKELGLERHGVAIIDAGRVHLLRPDGTTAEMGDSFIVRSLLTLPISANSKRILDAFYRFSAGVGSDELSTMQKLRLIRTLKAYGRPGVPLGGCSSIVNALVERIRETSGRVETNANVRSILVTKNRVMGVLAGENGERRFLSDLVISDVGPKGTARLLSRDYSEIEFLSPVKGIKISASYSGPPFGECCLVITPWCKRVAGIAIPSVADPELAPEGKHLLMSHQETTSNNMREEIQMGLTDLRQVVPDFENRCRILAIQTYTDRWPVNWTPPGRTCAHRVKSVRGLFLVGDAVKPSGATTLHIMTEGIVAGVNQVVADILRG